MSGYFFATRKSRGWLNSSPASFERTFMASRIGEKVPGWVERLLIPSIESRTRSIVKEEFSHLEKVMDVRLGALDGKVGALDKKFETRTDALDEKFETRIDALDEKFEARLDALDEKLESKLETLDTKIDSLEKRFPVLQDLAEIKARLAQVEKNQS
jgi:hypothetical protein